MYVRVEGEKEGGGGAYVRHVDGVHATWQVGLAGDEKTLDNREINNQTEYGQDKAYFFLYDMMSSVLAAGTGLGLPPPKNGLTSASPASSPELKGCTWPR
jgi:hypothetical protein